MTPTLQARAEKLYSKGDRMCRCTECTQHLAKVLAFAHDLLEEAADEAMECTEAFILAAMVEKTLTPDRHELIARVGKANAQAIRALKTT
jgi:hypothetical protein